MNKKFITLVSILVLASMLLTTASAFAENSGAQPPAEQVEGSSEVTTEPYTGWVTLENGTKRYYIDGKLVKNKCIKIGKERYCFNKKGNLVKKRTFKIGKSVYYLAKSGKVRAWHKGKVYYRKNGKKMNKAQTEDWKTRMTAETIAAKITTEDMTKKEKLKVCFDWVMNKPYVVYRKFSPTAYWPATYANDHFKRSGGDCHADGSALAYLAVAIGYKNVYVCNDSNGKSAQGHCWCEIGGKVYDPLFAQAKSYSKYYGASYKSYKLYPVLHIKMDYNKNRPKR